MPDQNQLHDYLHEAFGPGILSLAGPIPLSGAAPWAGGPTIDAGVVAEDALNLKIDPGQNRNAIIQALVHRFPPKTDPVSGKTTIAVRRVDAVGQTTQSGWPLVGSVAVAGIALKALSDHAMASLHDIEPFSSHTARSNHEPIVALIDETIRALNEQFASGRPLGPAVDALVDTLAGPAVDDGEPVCGYIRELGTRCGIGLVPPLTVEDEKVDARFLGLSELADLFARLWRTLESSGDEDYFVNTVQHLQQALYAIVTTLDRLRACVPAADWVIVEIPTEPRITALAFYRWMHPYCAATAIESLKQGRDGVWSVNQTMRRFAKVLGFLIKPATNKRSAPVKEPCAGVPTAFEDDKVQLLLQELLCHVTGVVTATRDARCAQSQVTG